MKRPIYGIICLIVFMICLQCESIVETEIIDIDTYTITASDTTFTIGNLAYSGYLSQPDPAGSYPIVLILHGSEGFQGHHKAYADSIAKEGYIAFTMCWFSSNSRVLMENVETRDFSYVLHFLKSLSSANPEKCGIVGFSAGAAITLYLGTVITEPSVIVEYYGINRIPSEAKKIIAENDSTTSVNLSRLSVPVLIVQGTADRITTMKEVLGMVDQLDSMEKTYDTLYFSNATHSFNWPDASEAQGIIYDEDAANDALSGTIAFLDKHLK